MTQVIEYVKNRHLYAASCSRDSAPVHHAPQLRPDCSVSRVSSSPCTHSCRSARKFA